MSFRGQAPDGSQINVAVDSGGHLQAASATVTFNSAPAVTAGAYTTGQVVGGLISIANVPPQGIVQSVLCTVKTALTAPYDVFFFDTNPSNSTFTDNQALAINTADLPSLLGVAHCTDAVSGGTPEVLQATGVALPFALAATTLYVVVVIRGGQTFASTTAFNLTVKIIK